MIIGFFSLLAHMYYKPYGPGWCLCRWILSHACPSRGAEHLKLSGFAWHPFRAPLATCWTHLGFPFWNLPSATSLRQLLKNAEGVWLKGSIFAPPALLEAGGESREWSWGGGMGQDPRTLQGWWPQPPLGAASVLIWKTLSGWCQGGDREMRQNEHGCATAEPWESETFPSLRLAGTQVNLKRHVNLNQ